jgi:hypothetical protein
MSGYSKDRVYQILNESSKPLHSKEKLNSDKKPAPQLARLNFMLNEIVK